MDWGLDSLETYSNLSLREILESSEEFFLCTQFDTQLIALAAYEGFLPMSIEFWKGPQLALKLHHQRCILELSQWRKSRSARRKTQGYLLTFNKDPWSVYRGIGEQHESNWLVPELFKAFLPLFEKGRYPVQIVTVELWQEGQLQAGDLGILSGTRYLSLTGFYRKSGSGNILLESLAELLKKHGFELWDLGMEMDYKLKMGATLVSRVDFIKTVHQNRDVSCSLPIGEAIEVKDLLNLS